jgi:phenylacetate-CoA ligase
MADHYDAFGTRAPPTREVELFSRLPDVLRKALTAPAYAEPLRGINPAEITSRAPLLRKADLALHRPLRRSAGLSPDRLARSDGCLPRRGGSSSPNLPTPTLGMAPGGAVRGGLPPGHVLLNTFTLSSDAGGGDSSSTRPRASWAAR